MGKANTAFPDIAFAALSLHKAIPIRAVLVLFQMGGIHFLLLISEHLHLFLNRPVYIY